MSAPELRNQSGRTAAAPTDVRIEAVTPPQLRRAFGKLAGLGDDYGDAEVSLGAAATMSFIVDAKQRRSTQAALQALGTVSDSVESAADWIIENAGRLGAVHDCFAVGEEGDSPPCDHATGVPTAWLARWVLAVVFAKGCALGPAANTAAYGVTVSHLSAERALAKAADIVAKVADVLQAKVVPNGFRAGDGVTVFTTFHDVAGSKKTDLCNFAKKKSRWNQRRHLRVLRNSHNHACFF